ncbi:MAG: hypothetical protein ACLGI7_10725, partial [Gammaproteobacteria bacterium]
AHIRVRPFGVSPDKSPDSVRAQDTAHTVFSLTSGTVETTGALDAAAGDLWCAVCDRSRPV